MVQDRLTSFGAEVATIVGLSFGRDFVKPGFVLRNRRSASAVFDEGPLRPASPQSAHGRGPYEKKRPPSHRLPGPRLGARRFQGSKSTFVRDPRPARWPGRLIASGPLLPSAYLRFPETTSSAGGYSGAVLRP